MRMRWTSLLLALLCLDCMTACARAEPPVAYRTRGHPFATLVTPDGRSLLVSEVGADEDAHAGDAAGLEVFRIEGAALKSERFVPLPRSPLGMALIPRTRTLAFGLADAVGFVDLDAVLDGQAKSTIVPLGKQAGLDFPTTSEDGRFLFATSEYALGGETKILALGPKSADGPFSVIVRAVISTPLAATDLVLSPDGSRLYVVSEVAGTDRRVSGKGQPMVERVNCRQGRSGPQRNGVLYAFDVATLMRLSAQASATPRDFAPALLSRAAAGCSPVRLVISADGQRLFVTARGDNRVLVFDARKLETDPDHALLHAFPSGGELPVGLRLTAAGRLLVVANSNRFNASPGNIAVLDAETGRILVRFKAGTFPRNVEAAPNGMTFVTDFASNAVEVLPPDLPAQLDVDRTSPHSK
jgi:hypothetical protein